MTTDTPRTDAAIQLTSCYIPHYLGELCKDLERELAAARDDAFNLADDLERSIFWHGETRERADKAEAELEKLKAGKVFVDPKWIYDLETQLAKAHEEPCRAGLREYGN